MECPLLVMADSYKAGHFKMYPAATFMSAYGEFRKPFEGMSDERIVVYGIRYYIEQLISKAVTKKHIDQSIKFYETHGIASTKYEYPADIFKGMLESGHFPVKIYALPEGSVVYPHTPVFIIEAEGRNSHFCTFLETILTMVWYPSCVATLSRHTKTLIEEAFKLSVDEDTQPVSYNDLLNTRLHDFGFRGCTCLEQSVLGGSAHLLNFSGSDTMSACYYVQFHLNDGKPVASSIPATEHSVMTSWPSETAALNNLIKQYPGQLIACVMDSFDYDNALEKILPTVIDNLISNNCTLILRPDSGDPVQQVVKALKAAESARYKGGGRCPINKKGYKVIENLGVIQGDGINYDVVRNILAAVHAEKYSAQNVAFGMGGGLLQKVNRDTMSFATKLSYIKYANGESKDIMKAPSTDLNKFSLPGRLRVLRRRLTRQLDGGKSEEIYGPHVVYPDDAEITKLIGGGFKDSMVRVYDHGPVDGFKWDNFSTVKARLDSEWNSIIASGSAVDNALKMKQLTLGCDINKNLKFGNVIASKTDKSSRALRPLPRTRENLEEVLQRVNSLVGDDSRNQFTPT